MLRLGMTRFMDTHERTHRNNSVAVVGDGSATDVNPLIRQLLLAREALDRSLNRRVA